MYRKYFRSSKASPGEKRLENFRPSARGDWLFYERLRSLHHAISLTSFAIGRTLCGGTFLYAKPVRYHLGVT